MVDGIDFDEIMDLQRKLAGEVAQEQETDNKITLMSVINDLSTGQKEIVQKEAVIVEAQNQGLTEQQTLRLLEELKQDNFIIEKEGYLKKI